MKKLLYLGFTALMMLFAMPSVVRAQDGDGDSETTPSKITMMLMDMGSSEMLSETSSTEVFRYMGIVVVVNTGQQSGWGPELMAEGDEEATGDEDGVKVYYTFDAGVTLSHAAYGAQGDDKKIFLAETMDASQGMPVILTNTNEDNVTLRVLACMIQDGEEVAAMTSDISSFQLTFKDAVAPVFSKEDNAELAAGTVVTITNVPEDGYVLYTTDGTLPVFMNQGPGAAIQEYEDGIEITGAEGSTVKIQAITYMSGEDMDYGSKMTTVTYTIATTPADKVLKPTITPNGGVVISGSTVAIDCGTEGATIRYKKGEAEWEDYTGVITITETCTLKACAVKTDMTNSDTAEVSFTIATKPDAPAFSRESGEVNINSMITVSKGDADSIFVATGKTEAEATVFVCKKENDGFVIVKENTVVRAYAMRYGLYSDTVMRTYTVAGSTPEDPDKLAAPEYEGSKFVHNTDKVLLTAETGATIRYAITVVEDDDFGGWGEYKSGEGEDEEESETTTPAVEWKQYPEGGIALTDVKDLEFQIKVCAVKDNKSSDTVAFDFVLIDSIDWTVQLDTVVGLNYPLMVSVQSPNYWDYADIDLPVHFYYTMDGTTEPSKEAFDEQAEGTETIKKLEYYWDEDAQTYHYSYFMLTGNVTLKVKAYVQLDEDPAIWVPVETVTKTVRVNEIEGPVANIPAGPVPAGIGITLSAVEGATIYYTVNGSEPLYNRILDDYTVEDEEIFRWSDFVMDYETWEQIPNSIIITKDTVIKAIAYVTGGGIGGWTTSTPAEGEPAGSQVVELHYTIDANAILPPAISAVSGYIEKGTEVEITAEEGLKVYYTTNDSVPTLGKEYTKEYTGKIAIDSNMTIKAIAMKEVENEGEKDTVLSFVSTAAFQVYSWSFDPKPGDTVDAGTQVAVKLSGIAEEDAENVSITFGMYATKAAAEAATYGGEYYVEGESQPELTVKTPVVKFFAQIGWANQLTPAIAAYTVIGEEPEKIDTIKFTFTPAPGEVADSTKVTIAFSRELGEEEYVFFKMFADSLAADTCADDIMLGEANVYGEPNEDVEKMGYPMITKAAPVIKVGYIAGYDEEGAPVFSWVIAKYTVKVQGGTAVEGSELAGVSLYPNPTEGEFNVVAPANAQVEIFNAAGMLVKRVNVNAGVNALRLENSGIYFVRVSANGQVAIKKVVVR